MIGIATCIWFAVAFLGRSLLSGVVTQQAPGYLNMGQINLYVAWPLFVVVALLTCASLCNAFGRSRRIMFFAAGVSVLALLPYLMVWGGGV
jgi:hypothetical protein